MGIGMIVCLTSSQRSNSRKTTSEKYARYVHLCVCLSPCVRIGVQKNKAAWIRPKG